MEEPVKLSMIVARARNGIIGKNGGLPWKLSDDLALFKQTTIGKPIIMGRHTWESLPKRPLPGRQNIIITRDWEYAAEGARVYSNLNAAINSAKAIAARNGEQEVFIIGGQSLYERALPMADILYISEIDADVDGDVSFPEFDESQFREVATKSFEKSERNDHAFKLRVLERIRS
ncbi:dihydrofolate reductase [Henriciella mobilis]|uniref:dihydrofolate reductase n=1 Tax=Henriciella mobilis TaxID=2305467 RepID=UPI000E673EFA|nr:dihydrofolate reductase [Henriciella mobilis]RIJ16098.1 dihydrofolate reductase [Henriciella mobilis]RIJ22990.1 dihydrofolate reductase [Henriciella mobilis]